MNRNIYKSGGSGLGMAKGLVKKIGLMAVGAGLVSIFSYGPKYDIDGSKVKDGWTRFNAIVEYKKGGDKVRYTLPFLSKEIDRVVINGKKYDSKDTLIYEEANKRFNYLYSEIKSRKDAKENLKIQKKLEKERGKINEALEILRK
jgi:hypothetical protein